ncbi:dockerin type I domain-containing protein [Candidatus Laterigemmans baculatus]|nr:dockerin type I domain-containing protein [Candidatus Laterigemmans baculatus]
MHFGSPRSQLKGRSLLRGRLRSALRQACSLRPTPSRRLRVESLEERRLLSAVPLTSSLPLGATPRDTGEYLLGRVAVTPVLLESDGSFDPSTEDWTSEEIDAVLATLAEGTQWWVDTLATLTDRHSLEFVIDEQFARNPQPSPYEPIDRPSNDFPAYVGRFLDDQGFADEGTLADAMRAFNHAQRQAHATDWAFTVFIVDSSHDTLNEDGLFAPGGDFSQAFAFAGGLFFITPSARPASTHAHELGHIFWARDEYPGAGSWTDRRGYYNAQNTNAADNPTPGFVQQPSIMSAGEVLREAYENHLSPASTLAMVGWQDSDGDGVFDVLDVPLELNASAVYSTESESLRVVGSASAVALLNANSSGTQSDITLNRVSRLEYRIDGGAWLTAATPDAQQVEFDLEIPLAASFSEVELRVIDATTGITSPTIQVPRDRPAGNDAALSGFVFLDRDGDSAWDADEALLPAATVSLVGFAEGTVGRVEPDDFAGGGIPSDQPGVQIVATGGGVLSGLVASAGNSSSIAEFFYRDNSLNIGNRWNARAGREFSATFDTPTATARITAIGGVDGAFARFAAYDIDGKLIARDTVGPLSVGQSATLRVSDPTGSIHRVVASGHAGTDVGLDDLRFGPPATITSDAVGRFSVADLPDGRYTLDVQPRLGIHGLAAGPIEVDVVAGAAVPLAVPLVVVPSPWQNPLHALDANNDGIVSPLDALVVINDLNRIGGRILDASDPEGPFVDINGDGWLSPLDALQVVNYLNRMPSHGEGIPLPSSSFPASTLQSSRLEASTLQSSTLEASPLQSSTLQAGSAAAVDEIFTTREGELMGTFGGSTALSPISSLFSTEARAKLDNLQLLGKLCAIQGFEHLSMRLAVLELVGLGSHGNPG